MAHANLLLSIVKIQFWLGAGLWLSGSGAVPKRFLGWLRGERGHCSMARVPTIAEEDAKRPNRERECLVGERTRIVNRIKSTLARLGIRDFKPALRKAAERLATVHTPEGPQRREISRSRRYRRRAMSPAAPRGRHPLRSLDVG